MVQAPQAELGAGKRFTFNGGSKELKLKLSIGQLAVLSGETSDKEITDARWLKWAGKGEKIPVPTPLKGVGSVVSGWGEGLRIRNLAAIKEGFGGVTSIVDPLKAVPFKELGSRFSLQNRAYGTAALFGSFSCYEGLRSLAGANYDPETNENISTWRDFKNKMGGTRSPMDMLFQYGWMPVTTNLVTDISRGQLRAGLTQGYFIAGIDGLNDLVESFVMGGPEATFRMKDEMEKVKKVNDAPLVDSPDSLNQPDPSAD